ncbi:KTSC domain-containing protein [Polyangium jinanense]|uniref:KTSC domain-containing protein n=1 Tax=Polyangium jinanense TaxID=2829994 RepID=A0A9X3XFC0_9BACT|nr:KTSC domain-containing protein [Polyangium jinanense]MDC3989354.1 KTSC domain-containing protein [Polyangium jinanense]
MQRIRVSSSNIASAGYDDASRILEVEFLDGSIYQYFGVAPFVYRDFMNASSHGGYLDAYVKKRGYRYRQIR